MAEVYVIYLKCTHFWNGFKLLVFLKANFYNLLPWHDMEKKEQKIQKVGRKKTIVYGPFECTNCTSKNIQILDTEQ